MRIYLDSNVLQDLKESKKKELYDLILLDKARNIYYYSEAHIQDLVRDPTDHKLYDMDFMETIVGDNCWHYDKRLVVKLRAPKDYYYDYEWNVGTDVLTSVDPIYTLMRESFRAIPIQFASLIDQADLPDDFPDDMRPMLLESSNLLEFMEAMLDLTDGLSEKQPKFKRLLQYLHRSFGQQFLYEKIGIKSYDGTAVTDWDSFSESFKELIYQRSAQKDAYNVFTDMQFALDIYGIVKGKPKKQKFMSLINDGKHAYYAGHAHILVTSDVDMIAKTEMVYRIWGIATAILTPEVFKQLLIKNTFNNNSVDALFEQHKNASSLPILFEKYSLDEIFIRKQLDQWFLGEFNVLNCASAKGYTYYYFSQDFSKLSSPTLRVEVQRIVDMLSAHFGIDELGRGNLDLKEFDDPTWKGREWRSGEMGVSLHINNDGLMLSFFRAAPLPEKSASDQQD